MALFLRFVRMYAAVGAFPIRHPCRWGRPHRPQPAASRRYHGIAERLQHLGAQAPALPVQRRRARAPGRARPDRRWPAAAPPVPRVSCPSPGRAGRRARSRACWSTRCCGGFRPAPAQLAQEARLQLVFLVEAAAGRARQRGIVQPGGEVPAHEGRARHRQVAHAPQRADAAALHRRRLGAHRRQHAALAPCSSLEWSWSSTCRSRQTSCLLAQRRQRRHEPGGQRVGIDGDGQRQRLRLARRAGAPQSCRGRERLRLEQLQLLRMALQRLAGLRGPTRGLARRISTRPRRSSSALMRWLTPRA